MYFKKHFAPKPKPPDAGEIRTIILSILHKNAPEKTSFHALVHQLQALLPGVTALEASRVLNGVCSEGLVLVDKLRKYVENPNPPKIEASREYKTVDASALMLDQAGTLTLPSLARAHQSGIIHVTDNHRTYKVFVKSFKESETTMNKLLEDMLHGKINTLTYVDHMGSAVKVWSQKGNLISSYDGSYAAMSRIRQALSHVSIH